MLTRRAGQVVTGEELTGRLWSHGGLNHERALAAGIDTLPGKLADAGFRPDPI
jgi:DNA-binding response OmpR family regulator